MKLSLRRKFKGPKYTIGDLSIDGTFFCNTIEDVIRELPDSIYEQSLRHKRSVWICILHGRLNRLTSFKQ